MSASTGDHRSGTSGRGEANIGPSPDVELDAMFMGRALELSARGQGLVEPNPMVGCVIVNNGEVVGEGWHRKFGGPHAEVEALRLAGSRARGATAYVTLEPCCHHGKTPPCTDALLAAGIRRVLCALRDPFEAVAGRGIAALEAGGVIVESGLMEAEARRINAPYLKLVTTGQPWMIAKWAMTLDGKIATRSGDSRWISGEASRAIVQRLRGRADAIVVGRGTAERDDPLLIARPKGSKLAARIVVDGQASLSLDSQLVRTVGDAPVIVATGPDAPQEKIDRLTAAGCEVFTCRHVDSSQAATPSRADATKRQSVPIQALLNEMGRRRMTNVLVEGGGELLGSLFDIGAIDEVHIFLAAKLVGGRDAPGPLGGLGLEKIAAALPIAELDVRRIGDDVYLSGRLKR